MPKEIIFCIDMQPECPDDFRDGYVSECALVRAFSDAARECDIPTWHIFYSEKNLKNVILHPDTPADSRDQTLKSFNQRYSSSSLQTLPPSPDSFVVFKQAKSAFKNSRLLPELRQQGIEKIYIIGHHADICVSATAFDAAKKEFQVVIVQDLVFGNEAANRSRTSEQRKNDIRHFLVKRLRRMTKVPFSVGIPSDEIFYKAEMQIRKTASNPDELNERLTEIATYYKQSETARGVIYLFERLKAVHDMQRMRHPHYLAMEEIKIVNSEDILSAHRQQLSCPHTNVLDKAKL